MSTYVYYIDNEYQHDPERGAPQLHAEVRGLDEAVSSLFSMSDNFLINIGIMDHATDLIGLHKYLVDTGYLNADDELINEDEAIFRSNIKRGYENLKRLSEVQLKRTVRITSLSDYSTVASYLNDHSLLDNLISHIILLEIEHPDRLHDQKFREQIRTGYALKECVSTVNGKPFVYCECLGLDCRYEDENHL